MLTIARNVVSCGVQEANKKVEKVIAEKDDAVTALTEDTVQLQNALKEAIDMAETEGAGLESLKVRGLFLEIAQGADDP